MGRATRERGSRSSRGGAGRTRSSSTAARQPAAGGRSAATSKFDDMKAAMDEQLTERVQDSYDVRKMAFGSYFHDFPEGVDRWRGDEKGSHLVDIIPWPATEYYPTKQYPRVHERLRRGENSFVYVLDVWAHRNIGANEEQVVCLARNYDEPCPACEYQRELRNDPQATDEEVKALQPKRRCVYLVHVHDSQKEYDKGLQIFETAHWFMERHLSELAKTPGRGGEEGGWKNFASPRAGVGKSVRWTVEIGTDEHGKKTMQFFGHAFEDRDYDVPDEILEQVLSLDEYLAIPTYEEFEDMLFGRQETTGEETPTAEPAKETRERKREPARADGENPCPEGLRFGVDVDTTDFCKSDCPEEIWKACGVEYDRLQEESKKEPEPEPAQTETERPTLARRRQ